VLFEVAKTGVATAWKRLSQHFFFQRSHFESGAGLRFLEKTAT
jgi:hypothetical protein